MKDNKIDLNEYKVNYPNSEKVYKNVDNLNIPYRAITISDSSGSDKQFHVYDTTGPYTDPAFDINLDSGLPKGRNDWLQERNIKFQSDTRFKTILHNSHMPKMELLQKEMEYVAARENTFNSNDKSSITPEFVRSEIESGRAIIPCNKKHPELEPMIIGKKFLTKVNANMVIHLLNQILKRN